MRTCSTPGLLAGLLLTAAAAGQVPVDTAFSYQGRIKSDGAVVNTTCDFEFTLWRDATSNAPEDQVGPTVPKTLPVTNGLFSTLLDFGAEFAGDARWLQIRVRCPGGVGLFTTVTPRQELVGTPYAIQALGAAGWEKDGGNTFTLGAVGIGTDDPQDQLDIAGPVMAQGRITIREETPTTPELQFEDGTQEWRIGMPLNVDGLARFEILDGTDFAPFRIVPGSAQNRVYISGSNVGIGTPNPVDRLHVSGNIVASGTCNCSSDARFKTNISRIDDALGRLLRLDGVFYDWRVDDFPDRDFDHDRQVGFVAQEVLDVFPEVVTLHEDGYYSLSYDRITVLSVEAIKELRQELTDTRTSYEAQLRAQDQRIARLEALLLRSEEGDEE